MKKNQGPPKLFVRLFRWFCSPDLHPSIEGDLLELYKERRDTQGKLSADLNFIFDVILLFRPGIIRTGRNTHSIIHHLMLANYFKVGFRNMLKYKAFSFINVFGLALAMSVGMLIILMLADQLRYDQFHVNKDRIYRINSAPSYATTPFPLAKALKEEYSIIEETVNLTPGFAGDAAYENRFTEMKGYFTDPSFFKVLGFELEQGNKHNALVQPNSIVISKEMASALFRDENPLGKSLELADRKLSFPLEMDGNGAPAVSWGSFTVTGIFDETKYKSHLRFDVLMSSATLPILYQEKKVDDTSNSWDSYWRTYTFVLLKKGKTKEDLDVALSDLVSKKYKGLQAEHLKGFALSTQPLSTVQFDLKGNDTNNRMPGMIYYFLGALAFIIILSACLNYTNLSIARALTRAKEIGVRKVTGANRTALVFQFLTESILTAMMALSLAFLILTALKPAFKSLWINKYLNFELPEGPLVYAAFYAFALLIGFVAGMYPAFRLSTFKPVKALKAMNDSRSGKLRMYKVLSVSQFVISLFFITTSVLIFNQFKHYSTFNYGFNFKDIVNVELQGVEYEKFANELRAIPGVINVSGSDLIPATGTNNGNQFKRSGTTDDEFRFFSEINVDESFIPNLDLKLIAGSNVPPIAQGPIPSVVLNESAVQDLGFKNAYEAIGEVIESKWGNEQIKIVGVIQNFRYMLLMNQDRIGGMMLRSRPSTLQYANVKIANSDVQATLKNIEAKWNKIDPAHSIQYKFFEDELADTHQAIFDIVSILGFVALLSIVISCLGLLGMATYTAERKRKEVGIRRVLGAESIGIVMLLSRGFLKLLLISIFIGAPLTYFINQLWLQRLPNRVEFGIGTLLLGIVTLLVLGVVTIGSQTIRASGTNPVDALKTE
jgi:putative ABC transport system permease protein